jgi:putative tricarboxylic transport membrane protein
VLAVFSIMFPWYQRARSTARWTLGFLPGMLIALSVPMFMMDSAVRSGIGVAMIAGGLWLLWRAHQHGWAVTGEGDVGVETPRNEPA